MADKRLNPDPDNATAIKDGVVQPEEVTTYNLVVDDGGNVVMVPVD